MQNHYQIRINFKGGIVAPTEMREILLAAQAARVQNVRFGLRQQMILHVSHTFGKKLGEELRRFSIQFEVDDNTFPNIVSSYVSEEVFQAGNWLTEGIYKDIFDGFEHEPHLKINVSDAQQSFTPFFSGHLNFVASQTPNFWYLYVRLPKTNTVTLFQKLIFTNEISTVSKQAERLILTEENNREQDIQYLFSKIQTYVHLPAEQTLVLPKFTLPYYEGFNRYGTKTWLGIYRRNELFSIDFLLEICDLCQATKVGEICLTPFKSLIIKGIPEKQRNNWSSILLKYNINVRHAANELNWQVEDDSDEALALKTELVKTFDAQDLRSFGLCFGIKTREKTEVYASIMIRKRPFKFFGLIPTFSVYDVSYTEDFNPNGRTKKYFAKNILRFNLSEQVRRNVLLFNNMAAENQIFEAGMRDNSETPEKAKPVREVVQKCKYCGTIYHPDFGDILNGIEPNIAFKDLPETYYCPTCEAPKSDFKAVEIEVISAEI